MPVLILVFMNAAKRAPFAHAAQRRTFSFSAEGYNSSLDILAPFAEDKLHINYSDIIPFFTNNMCAISHYKRTCCSKIDCVMI